MKAAVATLAVGMLGESSQIVCDGSIDLGTRCIAVAYQNDVVTAVCPSGSMTYHDTTESKYFCDTGKEDLATDREQFTEICAASALKTADGWIKATPDTANNDPAGADGLMITMPATISDKSTAHIHCVDDRTAITEEFIVTIVALPWTLRASAFQPSFVAASVAVGALVSGIVSVL